ncbi:uncharacterized protein LOC132902170 [Amyelois transitella]|uniref:uncharacterized protein LOC132902170 n=1 Tax=Amyelois transitella TaxID=680683 RepID=UPI0029901239|nr:uncharacterized protein LOC132902170 [Amyelois transitella]
MASSVIKCNNCNIVICEVLAFIQNKVDIMNEECLVRICKESFSETDIENAKRLLFESVQTSAPMIRRRRDGKSKRDLFDVIALFKETDPELVPIFCARDLQKLPPINFDHIDATRLLKDILILQRGLREVQETYVTSTQLSELRQELKDIKDSAPSKTSFHNYDLNINRKRGGVVNDSFCLDSGPMGLTHIVEKSSKPIAEQRPSIHLSPSPERCTADRVSLTPAVPVTAGRESSAPESPCEQQQCVATKTVDCNVLFADVIKSGDEFKIEKPSEKWTLNQKKRHRNRLLGTQGKAIMEPNSKFKAAETKIPLFINRVHHDTSEKDIIDYIMDKTRVAVTLKKIEMKYKRGYNSYKIFIPETKLSLFLKDDLWPEGISFRRFVYFKDYGQNKVKDSNDMNRKNIN